MGKKIVSMFLIITMVFSIYAFDISEVDAASKPSTYWLKVNRKANVVTAYKRVNGKYVPYRAMLCSSGGKNTPLGTSYMGNKYRWHTLIGPVWGQYCSVIKGDYLFHSVWYYKNGKKATVSGTEYNYLGKSRSHGCVRLSVMDAKWIYENCKRGTKITVYSSSNPGPLGKPKGIKVKSGPTWDPTDPDPKNPNFRLKKPVITISSKKAKTVEYGKRYSLKSGVTAKNVNAYQNLTSKVQVYSVKKYSNKKWVKASFSTKKLGTYKITYRVYDKYCGGASYKSFQVKVVDTIAPTITASSRIVRLGATNAVYGVTAKQKTRSRTTAVVAYIKAPGETSYQAYSYSAAKAYQFDKEGKYAVKYVVKNAYSPYRSASKIVYITSYADAVINVDAQAITLTSADTKSTAMKKIRAATTITDAGIEVDGAKATVTLSASEPFTADQEVRAKIQYKGKNGYTSTKEISIIVE